MPLAKDGYEPTTVHITLGRGAYQLRSFHLKSHHTLMMISRLPTFNRPYDRFPILTKVGYLV